LQHLAPGTLILIVPLGLVAAAGGVWTIVDSAGEIKVTPTGEAPQTY
jgi:hypothetical protein